MGTRRGPPPHRLVTLSHEKQLRLDVPIGPTDDIRRRHAKRIQRDVAAYLLDRADQCQADSPCWVALADAAHNIMIGEVDNAIDRGEFDAALYDRVDGFTKARRPKAVRPRLGVEKP